MAPDFPIVLSVILLALVIGVVLPLVIGLVRLGGQEGGIRNWKSSSIPMIIVLLIGWPLVTGFLAIQGVFDTPFGVPLALAANIGTGLILLAASPSFQHVLDRAPQSWIIGLQVYRVAGVVFLVLMLLGRLPAVFAIPAGTGDILVGLTALPVAYLYYKQRPGASQLALAWNVLGLIDLSVALTTGFLAAPTPLRVFYSIPSTQLLAQFPVTLIPTFAVPISILLHIYSLRLLWQRRDKVSSPPIRVAGQS